MTTCLATLIGSAAGVLFALPLALLPGMHVYNLLALLALSIHTGVGPPPSVVGACAIPTVAGMLTTYVFVSAIPAVFLAAPDDSALFAVQPGQTALRRGRGHEAVVLTSLGAALGLVAALTGGLAVMPRLLPALQRVLQPHAHWILWCIVAMMLQSEWPRTHLGRPPGWRWFLLANRSCFVGALTFLLAGILGMLIMWSRLLPPRHAFQGLMPAFLGLFTLPQLIVNMAAGDGIPRQTRDCDPVDPREIAHGTLAGVLGGGIAAFLPVVTGGIGGWLAGHATALRNGRAFLVSQGASRMVYYVGALLLFVTPPLNLVRGGAAWMLQTVYAPSGRTVLYQAAAAAALAGALAILSIPWLTTAAAAIVSHIGHRRIGRLTIALCTGLTALLTGPAGLAILAVATGIGLLPILHESRRMNCLGVILLPLACSMSGFAPLLTAWLRLA